MDKPDHDRLDRLVAEARRAREMRDTAGRDTAGDAPAPVTHRPFPNLRSLLKGDDS